MKIQIKQLRLKGFGKFYRFAKDFLLNQFLAYPSKVREFYWDCDFHRGRLQKAIKSKEKVVLVARSGEKIVGFAVLRIDRGGGTQCPWLGVDKDFRSQGVGSALVDQMEKVALERKCHFIFLHTENKDNIKFYKKCGYYLVGLQKEAWGGVDEYLLQKNLRKPFPEVCGR